MQRAQRATKISLQSAPNPVSREKCDAAFQDWLRPSAHLVCSSARSALRAPLMRYRVLSQLLTHLGSSLELDLALVTECSPLVQCVNRHWAVAGSAAYLEYCEYSIHLEGFFRVPGGPAGLRGSTFTN